jgi:hypothetical protein
VRLRFDKMNQGLEIVRFGPGEAAKSGDFCDGGIGYVADLDEDLCKIRTPDLKDFVKALF